MCWRRYPKNQFAKRWQKDVDRNSRERFSPLSFCQQIIFFGNEFMAATEPIKLNLKLAAGVKKGKLDKLLAETPGIQSVTQTFPDETDEELSQLYILEVELSKSDAAINALSKHSEIDYVEPTASRRLIRKTK